MNYYLKALRRYSEFNGRSSRKEYWVFNIINSVIIYIIFNVLGLNLSKALSYLFIYDIIIFIPSIAILIRRMHDVGKSGWYSLIPIYNLISTFKKGDIGDNKYGSPEK
ncbi:MAG: DUF805 domain-containing protein [Candidatus Paceibacterota bacterium]|jgi:uncharacterized membrane protein YhaH (DUF805 family)